MSWLAQLGFLGLAGGAFSLPFLGLLHAKLRPVPKAGDAHELPLQTQALAAIERFQANLSSEFGTLLSLVRDDEAIRGSSKRGIPFLVLGQKKYLIEQLPPSARVLRQWVVSARHLDIPGELICERPLHAEGRLSLAHNAVARSLHAQREIVIGPRARVRQWAWGGSRVEAAEGAMLQGFVGAGREIVLARQVRFTHLQAPRIQFGRSMSRPPAKPQELLELDVPPHAECSAGMWRVTGDLIVPAGFFIKADLVCSGRLVMGRHSRIRGSVHASGDVHLDEEAAIEGALFGDANIALGEACLIKGPLQAGGRLSVDACCEVGRPGETTTVSAHSLRCAESAQIFGAVHARYSGEVVLDAREHM